MASLEREPQEIKPYISEEMARLTQLYRLEITIKRQEKMLRKHGGKAFEFRVRGRDKIETYVLTPEMVLDSYDYKRGLYAELVALGKKGEADQMIKDADLFWEENYGSKVPEAYRKAFE